MGSLSWWLDAVAMIVSVLVMPAAAVAGFYFLLWRPCRSGSVRRDDYLREPPDDSPPVVVGMLFSTTPGTDGMVATLLDLVRRGVIELDAVPGPSSCRMLYRDDTELILRRDAATQVRPFEARLSGLAFIEERGRVSVAEIHDWWRTHEEEAERWYVNWWRNVTDEMVARTLLREDPRRWVLWGLLYGMGVSFASVLLAPVLGLGTVTGFIAGMTLGIWDRDILVRSRLVASGSAVTTSGSATTCATSGGWTSSRRRPWPYQERFLPLALVLGEGERALKDLDVTATHSPFTPWAHDPFSRLDLGDILDTSLGRAQGATLDGGE